jgi:hypothetical protein
LLENRVNEKEKANDKTRNALLDGGMAAEAT